jgi:hypothetical protein
MRFITPGLAAVAFAVTIGAMAWHDERLRAPGPPRLGSRDVPPRPAPIPSFIPAPVSPSRNAPTQIDDGASAAVQPTAPNPSALPSYQQDQAARDADALHSARSR